MTKPVSKRYHLGLPAWAYPGWKDRFFDDRPSRLVSYTSVFNTVEGNTTFYSIPDARTVEAWRFAVAGSDFRFCLKLPRSVTHEPSPDLGELKRFLATVRPLSDNLGPFLVQFPATLGPGELAKFEAVFEMVSKMHRIVIEVRHPGFFAEPEALEPLIDRYSAGRVMLDSRPLYEGNRSHPEVRAALHEKPDVPVLSTVYNGLALARVILHPDLVSNDAWITEWSQRVATYLAAGADVYMMIHCPNNLHCPPLARRFHNVLRGGYQDLALDALPDWPVPEQRGLPL